MRWRLLLPVLGLLAFGAEAQLRLVAADKPAAPAEPEYVDRVIEGLPSRDDEAAEARPYDREGLPRFLRIETRLGTDPLDHSKVQAGVVASGGIETPNHGVLSLDLTLHPSDGNSIATVRQRALPLDGGWLVNNEAGVLTPQLLEVMKGITRVFVPAVVTRGAQTEWLGANGLQYQASSGELGIIAGYPVPGFQKLAGTVTSAGAQTTAEGWNVGARYAYAHDVDPFFGAGLPRITTHSAHVAARRETADDTLQAQVIAANDEGGQKSRYGAWVDGEQRVGKSVYGWGFYRLDPNLTWAGQAMASDVEGAYVRGAWHTRQASTSVSVDVLRSITGDEDTGVLVSATGQWRYSRTLTFGGGATVRRYNTNGMTAFGDMRWLHDYGRSGMRAEYTDYTGQDRSLRLVFDHDWPVTPGWVFGTSLWGGRESGGERSGPLWGAAASLSAPLGADTTLLANGSFERRGNGDRYASANVSLNWRLTARWSIEGNAQYSRGDQRVVTPLDPLAPTDRPFVTQDSRSLYLIVRYEDRAGTRAAPLGGPVQGGGGRIVGRVFLDANGNGTMEAGEQGAAGVTVYLDRRYAARTDSQGRFEFPFVAPGARVITVVNETLPLPWEAGERADHSIDVRVRESAEVLIPVIRRN